MQDTHFNVYDSNNNYPVQPNSLIENSPFKNYKKRELRELIEKLIQENVQIIKEISRKRKLDNDVTNGTVEKKQKTEIIGNENALCEFLPYIKSCPITELSTIFLYVKQDASTHNNSIKLFKFLVPREALICISQTYRKVFSSKNQMADIESQRLYWNDPIEGPFYSADAVRHLLTFAYASSRNFLPELNYRCFSDCNMDDKDKVVEDLLHLINYYGIDEKLEKECADYIKSRVSEGAIADFFALSYQYPGMSYQYPGIKESWLQGVMAYAGDFKEHKAEKACLHLFDLIETGQIENLPETYSITQDLVKLLKQIAQPICNFLDNDINAQTDWAFYERCYQNVIQLMHYLPESLEGFSFHQTLSESKNIESTYATMFKALINFENEKKNQALQSLNDILEKDPVNSYALTNRAIIHGENEAFDLALKDLDRALEINPNDIRGRVFRAEIYSTQKQFSEGLKEIEEIITLCPNSRYLLRLRAKIYFKQGEYQLALNDLNLANEISHNEKLKYKDIYRKGFILNQLRNSQEALSYLNSHLPTQIIKNFDFFLRLYGMIHAGLGEKDKALEYFTEAIALTDTEIESYYYRAKVYYELACQGQLNKKLLNKAAKDIKKYLKNRTNHSAFALAGEIYYKLEEFEKAWVALKKAYDIKIEDENSLILLVETSFRTRRVDFALHIFEKAFELYPNNTSVLQFYAKTLLSHGLKKEAFDLILKNSLNSKNAALLGLLGILYHHLGDDENFFKYGQDSLELDNNHENALMIRFLQHSIKLKNEGNREILEKAYQELKTIKKSNTDPILCSDILTLIGQIFLKLKNKDKALEYWREATTYNTQNMNAFFLKGWFLTVLEINSAEAISDLSMVIRHDSNNLHALRCRAILYKKAGKEELAQQDEQKIIQLDPQYKKF